MKKTLTGVVLMLCLTGAGRLAVAQDAPVVVKVTQDVKHDVSPPLRDIPIIRDTRIRPVEEMKIRPVPVPVRPDPVLQNRAVLPFQPTAGISFDGVGQGAYGYVVNSVPPDTNGSVGSTQYVHWVNTSFAVFDKSGNLLHGPTAGNSLWSGFGGGCQNNNDGDIIVLWDKAAQRWLMSQFSVSTTPYMQCIAISTTSDATGTWYRYAFQMNNFNDYPKMGVWPDAYYASFNMFAGGTTFAGASACAYQRSAMLTGATATQQCFNLSTSYFGLLPSDLDGATPPPAGSPNYFLMFDSGGTALDLWKFHVDWTTPSNSTFNGPSTISVAAFSPACSGGGTCVPQPGTGQQLDSLADRLMYRLAYRNFGDHESLVVNHAVTSGSSSGIRWYEIRNPNSTPSVFQQGTFAPDSSYRWMGSVAMDSAGDIVMGYSVSNGSSLHPSIRYTGRTPSDPLGAMEAEATLTTGSGSQTSYSRWGDYSSMSVDPADDCTFWYTTEYLQTTGNFNWSTRVGTFKFPNCGSTTPNFAISASPTSLTVSQGTSGSSTINTTVSGGFNSAISLSASGLPSGTTATFNPTSIAASGSGSSNMTLNVGSSTATGTYTITVTGTGGGVTHTASVSLTVTSGATPNFTISASPPSVTISQGTSGTSAISTTVSGGFNSAISLNASGLPSGATATFNPASIAAPGSGSSTITITVGASTAVGTYSVTVTGTGGGLTRTTPVSLTVSSGGGGSTQLITDGGFESATASGLSAPGWTATTNISGHNVITYHGSYPHTGTNYAFEGAVNNDNDTLTQTLSIPANTTSASLTFWVNVVTQEAPGTAYDFLYLEIHNSSGTLLATPLTLSNLDSTSSNNTNGTYFQPAAVNMTAYAGQTIQIVFHATTDVSLPTTFRIDDVSLLATTGGGSPNFTISASPTSLTVKQGNSGAGTITTAVSGGFNSAIALSASGLPSGATASFNPASIAAPGSGSSTMTINASSSTPTGTYSVTVTGTGGGITRTTPVSLTVTSSGGSTQLITDGGFESATASGLTAPGWTATSNVSGRTVIIYHGSYPHTGTNYAFEGSSNNENDTLTQTVTIPSTATSAAFTFWVNVVTQEAPGTAYDFLYLEIHNSSGTLLATPLTLSNLDSASSNNTNGVYFQPASVDLSAYKGQTIKIVFHGTTDVSLPTTFRIDDVSLITQ